MDGLSFSSSDESKSSGVSRIESPRRTGFASADVLIAALPGSIRISYRSRSLAQIKDRKDEKEAKMRQTHIREINARRY